MFRFIPIFFIFTLTEAAVHRIMKNNDLDMGGADFNTDKFMGQLQSGYKFQGGGLPASVAYKRNAIQLFKRYIYNQAAGRFFDIQNGNSDQPFLYT